MLSVAVAALAFQAPPSLTRRDAVFAGVTAAAMPFAAFADGSAGPGTLQKARLSYGQRLLTLQDASTDAILENKATINLYVSAVNRACHLLGFISAREVFQLECQTNLRKTLQKT